MLCYTYIDDGTGTAPTETQLRNEVGCNPSTTTYTSTSNTSFSPIPVASNTVTTCADKLDIGDATDTASLQERIETRIPDSSEGFLWKSVTYGCKKCGICEIVDIVHVVRNFITGSVEIIGGLALLFFVYGAVLLVASSGNTDRVQRGRQVMTSTVLAMLAVILAWSIVNITISALTGTGNIFGAPWQILGGF